MVVDKKALIELISVLMSNAEACNTITHSLVGAAVCGVSCWIGGFVLGPAGFEFGGTLGGVLAHALEKDKFVPIGEALRILPEEKFEKLVQGVQDVVKKVTLEDVALLKSRLEKDDEMREAVIGAVTFIITDVLKLKITYRE